MLQGAQAFAWLERDHLLSEQVALLVEHLALRAALAVARAAPLRLLLADLVLLLEADAVARRVVRAEATARRLVALLRFFVLAIFRFSCVRT